jgi:hypothetical protein
MKYSSCRHDAASLLQLSLILPFVVLLLSLGIAKAQHGTDPNWLPQTALPKSSPSVSADGAVANNMAVQQNGTTLLFYTESSGMTRTPYYIGTSSNGATWTAPAPTVFTPATRAFGFGTVAADGDTQGNIHTLWSARAPAGIFYARWDAAMQRWSDTVRISGQIKRKAGFCHITSDRKGRVHAFWNDGENASALTAEVMYARSEDGGRTWSREVQLSRDDGKHSAFPMPDFSGATGDTLLVAWRDSAGRNPNNTQNWDIQVASTFDGGRTWSEPRTILGTTDYESDPNVIVGKNGIIYIAFHVYPMTNNFNARIMYGYSKDGGRTWLPQGFRQISETNIRSHLVKEAYDFVNDRPWFVWKDERDVPLGGMGGTMPSDGGRGADLMAAYISNQGETVSRPEFLTDAGDSEVGFHNFKVGTDGILRAHYFIVTGGVKTLYYTQRRAIAQSPTSVRTVTGLHRLVISPNPTSENAIAYFTLANPERVSLTILNALGQQVAQIFDETLPAGEHSRLLDMTRWSLVSGTYFVRLHTQYSILHTIPVQVLR